MRKKFLKGDKVTLPAGLYHVGFLRKDRPDRRTPTGRYYSLEFDEDITGIVVDRDRDPRPYDINEVFEEPVEREARYLVRPVSTMPDYIVREGEPVFAVRETDMIRADTGLVSRIGQRLVRRFRRRRRP